MILPQQTLSSLALVPMCVAPGDPWCTYFFLTYPPPAPGSYQLPNTPFGFGNSRSWSVLRLLPSLEGKPFSSRADHLSHSDYHM